MDLYQSVPLLPNGKPSIRLLEFPRCDVSQVSLTTYSLDNAPVYEALSYAWGTASETQDITVNGQQTPISQNLHQIFNHLTRGVKDDQRAMKRLWVDKICINQQDDKEKSHQVALMREIYTWAQNVIVWLGPEDNDTELAFETLANFAINDGTTDGWKTAELFRGDRASERRSALDQMIHKSWFSRVWVVQEVVASQKATVHWGSHTIDWEAFHTGLQRATGSNFFAVSPQVFEAINIGIWREKHHDHSNPGRDEDIDLRILIKDGSSKEATNLRDKVYALRGIASDSFAKGIIVNYADAVERVYIDCTKHILRSRRDLKVLSLIRQRGRGLCVPGLPSWVPDWSHPIDPSGVLNRYYRFEPGRMFRANGTTLPNVVVPEQGDIISASGIHIDRVKDLFTIEDLLTSGDSDVMSLSPSILHHIVATLGLPADYAPSAEPSWVALFRTLTADRSPVSPRINQSYRSKNFSIFKTLDDDDTWKRISASLGSIVVGKVLQISEKGYLGYSEDGCCVGDIICVLHGGEVPFLLRPDENGLFQLHGEVYVHGFMDGEALTYPSTEKLENFMIR